MTELQTLHVDMFYLFLCFHFWCARVNKTKPDYCWLLEFTHYKWSQLPPIRWRHSTLTTLGCTWTVCWLEQFLQNSLMSTKAFPCVISGWIEFFDITACCKMPLTAGQITDHLALTTFNSHPQLSLFSFSLPFLLQTQDVCTAPLVLTFHLAKLSSVVSSSLSPSFGFASVVCFAASACATAGKGCLY